MLMLLFNLLFRRYKIFLCLRCNFVNFTSSYSHPALVILFNKESNILALHNILVFIAHILKPLLSALAHLYVGGGQEYVWSDSTSTHILGHAGSEVPDKITLLIILYG